MRELWNVQSNKKPWINLATLFFIIGTTFFSNISPTFANTAAISWLQLNSNQDGTYSLSTDIALPFQSTSEAVKALSLTSTTINLNTAVQFLNNDTYQSSEYLSRKIMANITMGADVTSLIAELIKLQNSDGGFGELLGFDSTVLDTAFALEALAMANAADTATATHAIGFINSEQYSNGGFGLNDANEASVYITAQVITALQKFIFTFNLSTTLTNASDFLYNQQLVEGGWGSDWKTAVALIALTGITTDASLYTDAIDQLRSHQLNNGSWGGDIYQTALVLRALHLAENIQLPVDPQQATITGRVINSFNGSPITAVSVSLGQGNPETNTATDGTFNIAETTAGDYTITYSVEGFSGATHVLSLEPGQIVNVGTIRLSALPTVGVLAGTITDAATGLPLSGVLVQVTGPENVSVTTDTNGFYNLAIAPGAISITLSASGYGAINATANMVAGATLNFSPALSATGTTPTEPEVTVTGQVVAADIGSPLAGARIEVLGKNIFGIADASGKFELTGVESGDLSIDVSMPGYQSLRYAAVAPPGSALNLGQVLLTPLVLPDSITLKGIVTDVDSTEPIAGATVTVEGAMLSTTTGPDGYYEIQGIQQLEFSILASAGGYLSVNQAFSFAEFTTANANLVLKRASIGGLDINTLTTDSASYQAYAPVLISASLDNAGDAAKRFRLLAEVINDSGQVVHSFAVDNTNGPAPGKVITLLPNETVDVNTQWFTGIQVPGVYELSIKAFDEFTGQVLSQRVSTLSILPTQTFGLLTITATPRYTNLDAEEQVELAVTLTNRSNITAEMVLDYKLLDPDGVQIRTGVTTLQMEPQESNTFQILESFSHRFDKSGEYSIALQILSGVTPDQQKVGSIGVAPMVRIEASQSISPVTVVPDGDKRIRIDIQIKGVQQQ